MPEYGALAYGLVPKGLLVGNVPAGKPLYGLEYGKLDHGTVPVTVPPGRPVTGRDPGGYPVIGLLVYEPAPNQNGRLV